MTQIYASSDQIENVKIKVGFDRIRHKNKTKIRSILHKRNRRIKSFKHDWKEEILQAHIFWDSDVLKWRAAYILGEEQDSIRKKNEG